MYYGSGFGGGYIIGFLISCIVFGFITRAINTGKGREGGFWWGFFLGVIGIIVVACRSSVNESQPTYSYQSSTPSYLSNYNNNSANNASRQPAKPAEVKKPAGWKCAKCGKENEMSSKFCAECGERRHYKWVCAGCGKENAPEIKFCPECGNKQTEEQESTPQPLSVDEAFIESLQNLNSAAEIYTAFVNAYGASEDEDIKQMIGILEKERDLERSYGNSKKSAVRKLEPFIKNGMRFLEVDRSGEKLVCPACGKEQNPNRTACFNCGALFRD